MNIPSKANQKRPTSYYYKHGRLRNWLRVESQPDSLPTKQTLRYVTRWIVRLATWPVRHFSNYLSPIPAEKVDKSASYARILSLRRQLYDQGLINSAYDELVRLSKQQGNWYEQRQACLELALWHANQHTKDDAIKCLKLLVVVFPYTYTSAEIERALIIQSEALVILKKRVLARSELERHVAEHGATANLWIAIANTYTKPGDKIRCINKALEASQLEPLLLKQSKHSTYDRLTSKVTHTVKNQQLVTIIMPCYNASGTIATALESILNQTWSNLEVIVVDDKSTDESVKLVKSIAKRDSRVRLLKNPVNSGTYVARNIALSEARGEFVTCNDADDWSHPRKIERQVDHILKHPECVANVSETARLDEDLTFSRRGNPGFFIQPNISSLMFRRQPVLDQIGSWDSVRFGADSEFLNRLRAQFGQNSVAILPNSLYSFLRQTSDSLTNNGAFGFYGFFSGARKEYHDIQSQYHKDKSLIRYEFPMLKRPFEVPAVMLPNFRNTKTRRAVDVIIMADFRTGSPSVKLSKVIIRQAKKQRKKIGLVQLYAYNKRVDEPISLAIRKELGSNTSMLVYGERIRSEHTYIIADDILLNDQKYVPLIDTNFTFIKNPSLARFMQARRLLNSKIWWRF